jgi:hypothetical protein
MHAAGVDLHSRRLSFYEAKTDWTQLSDILTRIKRAVLAGRYAFSIKARWEMELDGLTELDVAESIVNAVAIHKKLRSDSPDRGGASICTSSRAPTGRFTISRYPRKERCNVADYEMPVLRKPPDLEGEPGLVW